MTVALPRHQGSSSKSERGTEGHHRGLAASSIRLATFDYLASLERIRAAEHVCMIGPAGTGKSHILNSLGIAAVEPGHRSATRLEAN